MNEKMKEKLEAFNEDYLDLCIEYMELVKHGVEMAKDSNNVDMITLESNVRAVNTIAALLNRWDVKGVF